MKETAMPPVPWQGTIWKSLCESIANDRLPHALLLHAMDGVGVEDLSLALVRYILCHAPSPLPLTCNPTMGQVLQPVGT